MKQIVTAQVAGKEVTFETGRIAKQAHGSVIVTCGSNIVMVTVVSSTRESTMDFFPLTVEFAEKFYATGKIPGGYFKREGRPTQEATLTARLIDRPMRPCFPEGYRQETQIVATVLSSDGTFPVDILASMGASAATHISDIPFNGPTAAAQVIRVDGKLIANPTREEVEKAELNITIAGTRNGILMVEGEANFITEAEALEALKFGHDSMMPALDAQEKLRELSGKEKRAFEPKQIDADLRTKVESDYTEAVKSALSITEKIERYAKIDEVAKEAVEKYTADIVDKDEKSARQSDVKTLIGDIKYRVARDLVLDTGKRIDGRSTTDIRQISCEVDLLPRAHGSGLFTRGETQVIGVTTLGTPDDEQMIDALHGTEKKRFMLHYNFPPYSVGETGRMGGQSRREIGHGFLAERAIKAILPDYEKFPYTIRVVSEVTESNGSSSMGTVCSGCLSLLDAGVPIKGNVSGIAMGLIKEGDRFAVLSDILGDEDHLGDMDFKVAGTRTGITSLQMDIKIDSISFEIMEQALKQAFDGR
ncbi:MAG: polyribonucleotide nucleotidyltransferase, partial [Bdellovibrionaceae bacterium]|nr:polyribonucleotide nucleotidyltransferase [Pseudobdellovibrionaceae bacterium]